MSPLKEGSTNSAFVHNGLFTSAEALIIFVIWNNFYLQVKPFLTSEDSWNGENEILQVTRFEVVVEDGNKL